MVKESRNSPRSVLARNVRKLRLARGFSQEDLAAEASTRQALVSEIEAGGANPTLDSLARLAEALHVWPNFSTPLANELDLRAAL
jgi:transcriptional regulator with XRE-family HTH domain